MNDQPLLVIGLVTVLSLCLWIILFRTVSLSECWKNILLGHQFVAVFFLIAAGMISYFFEVPIDIGQFVVRVIGFAPPVGGYLQFGRRKT